MSTTTLDPRAEARAFVARVARPANVIEEPYYFGLHIGAPGTGKTHILRTMPGKVLVIDCRDGGNGTAPLVPEGDRITVWPVSSWTDLTNAARYLQFEDTDFDSVAIDGLSKLQQYDLANIIQTTRRKDGTIATKMEKDMWGLALDHFTKLINGMEGIGRARKLHVAMTVWEKAPGGDDDSPDVLIPSLQGGIKTSIAGMFDIVAYHVTRDIPAEQVDDDKPTGPGKMEVRCLTQPYGQRQEAKCRWKTIDDEGVERKALEPLEEPNISAWIEKIREGVRRTAKVKMPEVTVAGDAEDVPAPKVAKPAEEEDEVARVRAKLAELEAKKEPEPDPENVAAAAALEAGEDPTVEPELPPADELLETVTDWCNRASEKVPMKKLGAFLRALLEEVGVASFKDMTPEGLAFSIEKMAAFEEEIG